MKLGLSGDYQQLVVKTIDTVHNHEVSEVTIVQLIRCSVKTALLMPVIPFPAERGFNSASFMCSG